MKNCLPEKVSVRSNDNYPPHTSSRKMEKNKTVLTGVIRSQNFYPAFARFVEGMQ